MLWVMAKVAACLDARSEAAARSTVHREGGMSKWLMFVPSVVASLASLGLSECPISVNPIGGALSGVNGNVYALAALAGESKSVLRHDHTQSHLRPAA
jgi:hypothetical protein